MSNGQLDDRNDGSGADSAGNDCYSDGERAWMKRGQQWRAQSLQPILVLLTAAKIRPDTLTFISLFAGTAFAPFWFADRPVAALIMLFLHVALDGLDGPLARHQSRDSPRGSFTDTFCDQLVLSLVTICLMLGSPTLLGILAGSLYLVLYLLVVAIAMVRNSLRIPYAWLIRPRFALFVSIPLGLWIAAWIVTAVVWISNALLAVHALTGFLQLRRRLRGPSTP